MDYTLKVHFDNKKLLTISPLSLDVCTDLMDAFKARRDFYLRYKCTSITHIDLSKVSFIEINVIKDKVKK